MSRRALAAVTAIWLIACGVLGARHEARAAHYFDAHGQAFHASKMTGQHTTSQSDVHARDSAPDHDPCSLVTAHHVTTVHVNVSVSVSVSDPRTLTLTLALTPTTANVLAVAPKTSPPTNA
jgi:hypothetical protein